MMPQVSLRFSTFMLRMHRAVREGMEGGGWRAQWGLCFLWIWGGKGKEGFAGFLKGGG